MVRSLKSSCSITRCKSRFYNGHAAQLAKQTLTTNPKEGS